MPDNQELHIGTVSKPRLSPETIYDVEYTQTLPSNLIEMGAAQMVSSFVGSNFLVSVNGGQLRDNKMTIYQTEVEEYSPTLWEASRKVGANREFRWTDPFDATHYVTIINLNGIFPVVYSNWDLVDDPTFELKGNWRSFLVYKYVNIEAIPDEATRLSLTQGDIYWTDWEGGISFIAWIYVVETKTLWKAVDDPTKPPTDPPGWQKMTENIIIDFPAGVNHKQQYIVRGQAVPASTQDGHNCPIKYRATIRNPDDPNDVRTISGESSSYSALSSPFGSAAVFFSDPTGCTNTTNGDMHGTITMTETPI